MMTIEFSARQGEYTSETLRRLREAILLGTFQPGQPLRQDSLAEMFGVSRGPVREALRALEAEGLLKRSTNIGYMVPYADVGELEEINVMRSALEAIALRNVRAATSAEVGELEAINKRIAEASSTGDIHNMILSNKKFHFRVFELSGRPLLIAELDRLWAMYGLYRSLHYRVVFANGGNQEDTIHEHEEAIKAVADHDAEALVVIMDRHRQRSHAKVRDLVRSIYPQRTRPSSTQE